MSTTLGLTRLGIPPKPPHLVSRNRLIDAIEAGASNYRLVLVSAPAGYGKSTALACWARDSRLPVAWMTVEPPDNDIERFLRYMLTAWEHVDAQISEQPPGLLLGSAMPDIEASLQAIIEAVEQRDEPLIFVIDDYQLIDNPTVHEAMTFLLDHLPSHGHMVLGTRDQPPLPLARYRARQSLIDIGPDQLRFQPSEIEAFLNDTLALDLEPARITSIGEQVEGWVAGLQLAALTIQNAHSPTSGPISGRHRFIADFLRDEVLGSLSPEIRRFLVATSIADRVNASLAKALTDDPRSQETLEHLERSHLFTMPLDDMREWYRYHRLFADVLRDELARWPADTIADLHRRAARWYIDHDLADPAFEHAMAAQDLALVTDVLNAFAQVKMFSSQVATLQEWMQAIPSRWYTAEPNLDIFRAAVCFFTGQIDACVESLGQAGEIIKAADHPMPATEARLVAMQCFVACVMNDLDRAQSTAEVALQTLVPEDDSFRGGVLGALGDTYRRNGYWAKAHAYYLQSLQHANNPEGHIQSLHTFGGLADLELRRGNLRNAAGYWQRALAKLADPTLWGVYPLPLAGWVHTRYGEILYEWNDLEAARSACDQGSKRAELGGDPRSVIASTLLATRLHLARGDHEAAVATIEETRQLTIDTHFPEWTSELERCQVDLWLAQGKLRTAVAWADETLARGEHPLPDREPSALAIARVLIVKGDATAIEGALSIVDPLIEHATTEGRTGLQIAALALRALALDRRGDSADALSTLEPALRLAEPEGYVRSFVDLGLPMAQLLQQARHRHVQREWVDSLLSEFDTTILVGLPSGATLPESLSSREREVLQRIAAGLTNREIAENLYISAETVKKHTGNIYGKLGVRGRTEAIARARELDLLN